MEATIIASDPNAVIRYEMVTKRFRSHGSLVTALDDVSLSIRANEFTSVVGPSGCGKTTLLRLASGLEFPTEGRTLFRGVPIAGINTQVGYITQDSNLYPWMTLRQNIELPLEIQGVPADARRDKADTFLKKVGLTGFENHWPYQLSGGMQKRGSIIRTMIYDPAVVLMDEPFGPLDAQTRMVLQADLLRVWAEKHQTVLFITHDLTEAIAMSDTVVVMTARPGRIKKVFTIPIPRPRDLFQIHEQSDFARIYAEIWDCLRSEVLGQQQMGVTDLSDVTS